MVEGKEHKAMKKCAIDIFGGTPEKAVNGRVDVKAQGFCVEIETSSRTYRIKHAIDKLSSSKCGGGFIVVPQAAMKKTRNLVKGKNNVVPIPSDLFKKICSWKKKGGD